MANKKDQRAEALWIQKIRGEQITEAQTEIWERSGRQGER